MKPIALLMRATAICLLIAYPASASMAATEQAGNTAFMSDAQLAKQQPIIDKVERYLSELTTIVSDFTQIAPDGSLTSGKFYLKRPGKMRWQYNPPTPILMVSNGSTLVYYDYELEQVSNVSLDSTLIGFLAEQNIELGKSIGVTDISSSAGVIRVTLLQRDKPSEGQLMLEFSEKPFMLRNMVITDATNQITSVSLNDAKFGIPLEDNLFVFRDPRQNKRKSR
jgi:outer membrane lipoprotein-sorting protein